ncbi:MAG: translation initiation factor IF-2 [bacterium]
MNVTELARKLRVTPKELLEKLPLMGFHVGARAIKVDPRTAQRILKEWPILVKKLAGQARFDARRSATDVAGPVVKKDVKVPNLIIVRDFATVLNIPVNKVLAELIKNGIFASLNQQIDFDTSCVIGSDLGYNVTLDEGEEEILDTKVGKLAEIIKKETEVIERPPVIVVMGHVDHGKTRLLDSIRSTNVVAGEAGGITQHIGAYQITRNDKVLTFIDTPGHEAFTAMRGRGAKIADIAILVVAADDGVKPQTIEAFRIIEAAKIPYVVAINKIDKEDADITRTKQDLSTKLNIIPDDWGGKIACAPISAKNNIGIEELLDVLLLTAEFESESMKANPATKAAGTIIEAHVDKGAGPVATVLIQNGTLRIGDPIAFNGQMYGKVRNLKNYRGEDITEAGPSTPAKILGLKMAPAVGDVLESEVGEMVDFKQFKKTITNKTESKFHAANDENIQKINVIIKADALGSAEAIQESLEKIASADIRINVISKGLGNINEGDVIKAETTKAKLIGFNVKAMPKAEYIAREKNVSIKLYRIIYDLINDLKAEMQEKVAPEIRRVDLGKLQVKAIFRTEGKEQVIGGKIIDGKAESDCLIDLERNNQYSGAGKMLQLQAGREIVTEVDKGQECGIKYYGDLVEVDDILILYKEEKIIKKL